MTTFLSTREVCKRVDLTEPVLRHLLRLQGAPRPQMHPSARVFLWTESDLAELLSFIGKSKKAVRFPLEAADDAP